MKNRTLVVLQRMWWVGTGVFLMGGGMAGVAQDMPVKAQPPVPIVGSAFQFVPGTWATYKLKPADGSPGTELYFAVFEKRKRFRRVSYWMEFEVVSKDTPPVVTRMLVPDTGEGPGAAAKAYVQIEGYRPFEVPRSFLKPDPHAHGGQAVGQFATLKGGAVVRETWLQRKGQRLKVALVEAVDAEGRAVQVAVCEEVLPLGVVRLRSPELEMDLVDWGEGAVSKIVGKPVGLWRWLCGVVADGVQ